MPKDWDNHKAEIERLYMVEHRPLKDVQNILRTQYAFDASIRSYRMKLDEWRMWKNNSKTERRRTKTISRRRQPRAITVAQSLEEAALPPPLEISTTDYVVLYGVSIPSGPLDIAELLPLISCLWAEPWSGLELMLFKWRPDGSYFKAAMNYLRDTKVPFRINFQTLAGTSIFRYIEDNVASHEKYPLAKMCLVLDFERFQNTNHGFGRPFPEWMSLWREACAYQTWKGVKECLDKFYYSLYVGSYFTPTALNFLAEKLLEKNLRKLAQWRDRIGVISISEADQAKLCRQESMDILDNFKDDGVYIDPIWYKRFFQCHETNDIEHWAYESLQLNQLREYRQKFYQLKILHDSASSADGLVPNLLNAATVLKESKVILDMVQCEDVPLTNEDPSQHPSTPILVQGSRRLHNELRILLKDVYETWVIGHDISKNVYCFLRHLKSFSISNPLNPEENVFILISQTIPPKNQVRFILDVLKAITKVPDDWDSWIAVRDASTLESLRETVAKEFDLPYEIRLSLDDRMQPMGAKLILDAFAGLIGEHVLFSLKTHIKRSHAEGLPYTWSLCEYKSILDRLHRRKIKVNQDLFAFLGRLLVWEGIDENGTEDEEERMFFASSDDESNNSESESLESETESEDQ